MIVRKINHTNNDDLESLKNLLEHSPLSRKTFRYFEKREFSTILNHIYTALYYNEDNDLIGYGHLDEENEKIWLGILVSDNFQNKGFGKLIMNDLLKITNKPIHLSVDESNVTAINLYKKMNFVPIDNNNQKIIMIKK